MATITKCCKGDEQMDIGHPQQSVSTLCVRGSIWTTRYFIIRFLLTIFTAFVCLFSFLYYEIPLFNTTIENESNCCYMYWGFYISSWYLLSQTLYLLISIYLQYIVYQHYVDNEFPNYFTFCNEIFFQLMRLLHLFAITTSSIYIIIYWLLIDNKNYVDSFDNINNPSDIGNIFNNIPLSFIMLLLQNFIIPILIIIDCLTNLLWYKYKDCIVVFSIILVYICMMFIHYLLQYTNEFGEQYVYYFYNFNSNQMEAAINCAITLFITTVWSLLLIFIKRQLILRWINKNYALIPIQEHQRKDSGNLSDDSDAASLRDVV